MPLLRKRTLLCPRLWDEVLGDERVSRDELMTILQAPDEC